MKRLLLALLLVVSAPLAQGEGPIDETRFTLREEFLRLINRDRKQFGLQPVKLDPLASVVADAYCRDQIRNGTTGHYTTDGQAPYMRYSFAGGNDGVSENAAAWSANYSFSDRAIYLPDRVLDRPKTPLAGFYEALVQSWRDRCGAVAPAIRSPLLRDWIDEPGWQRALAAGHPADVMTAWRVLQLDAWLTERAGPAEVSCTA